MIGARMALARPRGLRLSLPRRPPRRALIGLAAAAIVLGGGFLWLRDSSLASVQKVTITGLPASDGPAVRAALRNAALDMTTLHVRLDRLRTAVSPYPVVRELHVKADFPHTLRITVVPYEPVAVLVTQGRRIPVAADGTILRGQAGSPTLTAVPVGALPGGRQVADPKARAAVALLGAAPRRLRTTVDGVRSTRGGLHVEVHRGPELIFGAPTRLAAKWAAAARVLSDPAARGATYVDLRVPERPVAGRFSTDAATTAPADAVTPPPTAADAATGAAPTPASPGAGASGATPDTTAP